MSDPPPSGWARNLRWGPLALTTMGLIGLLVVFVPGNGTPQLEAVTTSTSTTTTTTAPPTTTTTTTPVTTTTTVAVGPRGGGALVALAGPIPTTVHPWATETSEITEAVAAVTAARAFATDPVTLDPIPSVLAEIPSLENGGLVYGEEGTATVTLRIRPEARWSDGTPITGSDFVFTAQLLAADARLPATVRSLYGLIVEDSWLVGPDTVRFTLSERTIEYVALFDPILPRHQMEGTDLFTDWLERPWLSGGPFVVEQIDADGVQLVASPSFWELGSDGQPLPYLERLELTSLSAPDGSPRPEPADVTSLPPGPIDEQFADAADSSIFSAQGREWEHMAFQFGSGRLDVNPRSLNASLAFRTAAASLIDRTALTSEFFPGERQPLDSVVGASWSAGRGTGWPEPTEMAPDLLEQIAAELETTFEEPPTVELVTTDSLDRTQFVGAVLQSLASAGFGVDVSLEDPGLFFRDFVIAGEFDLAEFAWTATPGPVGAVRDLEERFVSSPTRGGFNFSRWGSDGAAGTGDETEAFRALVAGLDDQMDLSALAADLQRADDTLASNVVVIPLYIELTHAAVADSLTGYIQPAGGLPVTTGAALWQNPSGTG